jgi:hypothetical protein
MKRCPSGTVKWHLKTESSQLPKREINLDIRHNIGINLTDVKFESEIPDLYIAGGDLTIQPLGSNMNKLVIFIIAPCILKSH